MRRTLLTITIFAAGFCSCNKAETPLTRQQIKEKVDSLFIIRTRDADERARIDLQRRIEIEVKVKADSIYNAMQQRKDTAKKAPVVLGMPVIPSRPSAF